MIDNEEFAQILKDIIRNDTVKKLKYFRIFLVKVYKTIAEK